MRLDHRLCHWFAFNPKSVQGLHPGERDVNLTPIEGVVQLKLRATESAALCLVHCQGPTQLER